MLNKIAIFDQQAEMILDRPARGASYPKKLKGLMVTADGGGSNGYRVRLWKIELQKLANELGFASAPVV